MPVMVPTLFMVMHSAGFHYEIIQSMQRCYTATVSLYTAPSDFLPAPGPMLHVVSVLLDLDYRVTLG